MSVDSSSSAMDDDVGIIRPHLAAEVYLAAAKDAAENGTLAFDAIEYVALPLGQHFTKHVYAFARLFTPGGYRYPWASNLIASLGLMSKAERDGWTVTALALMAVMVDEEPDIHDWRIEYGGGIGDQTLYVMCVCDPPMMGSPDPSKVEPLDND